MYKNSFFDRRNLTLWAIYIIQFTKTTFSWFKITQYACDYDNLAPDGCTQYYFGATTDIVRTYNYEGETHLADQDQLICIRYVLKTNYLVLYNDLIFFIVLRYNKSAIWKVSYYLFFMNLEGSVDIAEYAGQRLTTAILRRVAISLAPQVRVECTFIFTVDDML